MKKRRLLQSLRPPPAVHNARRSMASSGSVGTRSMASSGSNLTPYDYDFKVVLCGNEAVGKTTLVRRYTRNSFSMCSEMTMCGYDVAREEVEQHKIKLGLWDIGGMASIRRCNVKNFTAGAHAVILCFDVTNAESFENWEEWLFLISKFCGGDPPLVFLVGIKAELANRRVVSRQAMRELAAGHPLLDPSRVHEVHCSTGVGVRELFAHVAWKTLEVRDPVAFQAAYREHDLSFVLAMEVGVNNVVLEYITKRSVALANATKLWCSWVLYEEAPAAHLSIPAARPEVCALREIAAGGLGFAHSRIRRLAPGIHREQRAKHEMERLEERREEWFANLPAHSWHESIAGDSMDKWRASMVRYYAHRVAASAVANVLADSRVRERAHQRERQRELEAGRATVRTMAAESESQTHIRTSEGASAATRADAYIEAEQDDASRAAAAAHSLLRADMQRFLELQPTATFTDFVSSFSPADVRNGVLSARFEREGNPWSQLWAELRCQDVSTDVDDVGPLYRPPGWRRPAVSWPRDPLQVATGAEVT